MAATLSLAARLADLHEGIVDVVRLHTPSEAAVEATFHGVSARSALVLAHARGVVLAVLGTSRMPVHEYSPATIKKAVTGNGRAEKAQIESMVSRLVPGDGHRLRPDVADAVATALCHLFAAATADALSRTRVAGTRR